MKITIKWMEEIEQKSMSTKYLQTKVMSTISIYKWIDWHYLQSFVKWKQLIYKAQTNDTLLAPYGLCWKVGILMAHNSDSWYLNTNLCPNLQTVDDFSHCHLKNSEKASLNAAKWTDCVLLCLTGNTSIDLVSVTG